MMRHRVVAAMVAVAASFLVVIVAAQGPQQATGPFELRSPFGDAGEAIYAAYDGWGAAEDGSGYLFLLGYYNRNRTQTVEIPVGPNNRIEPGGPDYGQPTVFYPGRHSTLFMIKVPKDFGEKTLTWTIVANGRPTSVTFHMQRDYALNYYKDDANGNEPPSLKFGLNDPMVKGPQAGIVKTLTGVVGQPLALEMWALDPPPLELNWESVVKSRNSSVNQPNRVAPPPSPASQAAVVDGQVIGVSRGGRGGGRGGGGRGGGEGVRADLTVSWTKLRGPGEVIVTPSQVPLVTNADRNVVVHGLSTATFSAPGEYVLRGEAVEAAGAGDGLCCLAFANVKVIIK
jgi:hypothetical protein